MPKKLSTWFMEAPNCTAALKNARYILKSFQISSPIANLLSIPQSLKANCIKNIVTAKIFKGFFV